MKKHKKNDKQNKKPPLYGNGKGLSSLVEDHVRFYLQTCGEDMPHGTFYKKILQEVERPLLQVVLEYTDGNQLNAAKILGINRNTLRKKIGECDIAIPEFVRKK